MNHSTTAEHALEEGFAHQMASHRGTSPMTNRRRPDGNGRANFRTYSRERRSLSPKHKHHAEAPSQSQTQFHSHSHSRPQAQGRGQGQTQGQAQTAGRSRFDRARDEYPSRSHRKRDYSPESRQPAPRRLSVSPARSSHLPSGRSRYTGNSAYSSRDSSPARFSKRRRTRSPSPSDWSDRGFDDRKRFSRSRSRDRLELREQGPGAGAGSGLGSGPRPGSRRGYSPRRLSPTRATRKGSRPVGPDVDTYIPERRRQISPHPHPPPPVRQRARRSPSPRPRSLTPPYRQRSVTPPSRRYPSRPDSPASRYDPPLPNRNAYRDFTPPSPPSRRQPVSRSPSIAGDIDREPMDGPFPARGNHGNPNHLQRGRGQRPYYNNRGAHRHSTVNVTPNVSHHDSPQSEHSYRAVRGGRDESQPQYHQTHISQSFRNTSLPDTTRPQSQDEYYRNQQQSQQYHQQSNQSQLFRPYRGARGGQQRAAFNQRGQDRRFAGSEHADQPFSNRGRGGQPQTAPWHRGGRAGSQIPVMTGPNSIKTSPIPSHRDVPDEPPRPNTEQGQPMPPREPQADSLEKKGSVVTQADPASQETPTGQKDASKFSFAFKSKQMPPSPVKQPVDTPTQPKAPPTQPALDRPPPTQPRGNMFHEKRPYNQAHLLHHNPNIQQHDRRQDVHDQPFRPPRGPQALKNQHAAVDRARPPPTEPRTRSRSPPPKKMKTETPFKPTLTPEMAASDSVYYRKPGNESVVGAGTYGKVFKAIHIFTKGEVALKRIRMEGERDGFPITAVREINLLQNLRHKHVVALQEVMVEKNECFMVFEYMSHDLTGLINHPTFRLTAAHKKDLGRQIFEGLEFLHRRGVMHRDIKAANLLISSDGQLKYADFGLARFYTKARKLDYTNRVITIWYRPPELLLGETQYGPAVDIWSAACVFMEMFTRKAIFPGEGGELSQLEKIYNLLGTPSATQWPAITDLPWYELMQPATATHASGERRKRVFESQFADVLSPAAMDLVSQIFRYDPATRPDAAKILNHDYFRIEEPRARQAIELAEVGGDWHEYESKAHRKENERKEKERRKEEHFKEKEREKRKAREDGGVGEDRRSRGKGVDEVPAAPMPAGEEDDLGLNMSDEEGSARMSMS